MAHLEPKLTIQDSDIKSLRSYIGQKNTPGVYLNIPDEKTLYNSLIEAPKTIIGTNEQDLIILLTNIGLYNKEYLTKEELYLLTKSKVISDMDMVTFDNTKPIFPKFTIKAPIQISNETIILCTKDMEYVTLLLGLYTPHNTYFNFKEENRKIVKLPIQTILKSKNIHRISFETQQEQETF